MYTVILTPCNGQRVYAEFRHHASAINFARQIYKDSYWKAFLVCLSDWTVVERGTRQCLDD